jgi:TRAP-type C4-dicarboxylate transport system substrate-binding protein
MEEMKMKSIRSTKKIKTLFVLVLSIIMAFSFAACGGSDSDDTDTAGDNDTGAESEVEALDILFSSTFSEAETGGKIVQNFIDKVGELSDGQITVNINWGGTLFDSMGEFDAISEGAVNMVAFGHLPHTGTLNYLGFPGFAPGGSEGAIDYFNDLLFDNPETSVLIQEEAAENNIKYLNVIAGGTNALCASYEFTDLASLVEKSKAFGNFAPAQWEALGFHVVPVTPPETYDAFNRGLIDSTQMGLSPMVAMAWYEVAPYWALDGTYAAGNMITVNLEWWDGLSPVQQDIIQQAADDTEEFSINLSNDAIDGDLQTIADSTGNPIVELSDDDLTKLWAACFDASSEAALANAEKSGKTEGMVTILEEAAKITGYDWQQ